MAARDATGPGPDSEMGEMSVAEDSAPAGIATASALAIASSALVGSALGRVAATGWIQSVNGCQIGENWNQPPTTDSTARITTGQTTGNGPSPLGSGDVSSSCVPLITCSSTNGDGSPTHSLQCCHQ